MVLNRVKMVLNRAKNLESGGSNSESRQNDPEPGYITFKWDNGDPEMFHLVKFVLHYCRKSHNQNLLNLNFSNVQKIPPERHKWSLILPDMYILV